MIAVVWYTKHEYNGVTVCIDFVFVIIIIIIIIIIVFFVIIFSGWFLLAMSYFNVPTLNEVINKIKK